MPIKNVHCKCLGLHIISEVKSKAEALHHFKVYPILKIDEFFIADWIHVKWDIIVFPRARIAEVT